MKCVKEFAATSTAVKKIENGSTKRGRRNSNARKIVVVNELIVLPVADNSRAALQPDANVFRGHRVDFFSGSAATSTHRLKFTYPESE